MSFFINDAWAEVGLADMDTSGFASLVPLILIFVVFYFLLLRPQIKRAKEHKQMVATLSKGDEVVSSGGLLGKIIKVDESFVTMEIADGVRVKMQKSAVTTLVPKGTIKSADKSSKSSKSGKSNKSEQAALTDQSAEVEASDVPEKSGKSD